jgi:outer membrane immunogenic protein
MRKHPIMVLAALALIVSQASAADLPRKAPAYVPPAPPPYVWTGCYAGGNIGGAWSNVDITGVASGVTGSGNNSGLAGGGQFGCDYQMGPWVIGFRNLIDAANLSKSRAFADSTGGLGTVETRTNWFDALTARGGYLVQPNLLFYVQGGAAWTDSRVKFVDSTGLVDAEFSNNRTGWTVGGGVEWMFVPHWSVFVEYNFVGFGTRSSAFLACGLVTCGVVSAKADLQDVLVGVNFRF